MKMGWHFNKQVDQSRSLQDGFVDSKFSIDKWTSYTREIIQNSMDAVDEENKPVRVVFDLNQNLTMEQIPGGSYLKDVIKRCYEASTHKQTKNKYQTGFSLLEKPTISCLKVSDYNTRGIRAGDRGGWDALLNYIGLSVKNSGTSAGSHGIGKKAPFIISSINTVLYSTYNIDKQYLTQGKTTLTNWMDENDNWMSDTGWFGIKDDNTERIREISITDYEKLDGYFTRVGEIGTDVISIGINEEITQKEDIKKTIINSVLENFFIAISERKLEVLVFGVNINASTIDKVIKDYYEEKFTKKGTGSDNIVFGLLKRYYETFLVEDPIFIDINDIGRIKLYISITGDRKYYAFFRSHGMKIRDTHISEAEQYFSAVAVSEEVKLNEFLANLETPAHDDFIPDENSPNYKNDQALLNKIYSLIKQEIVKKTKIEVSDTHLLDELNEMIDIVGSVGQKTKKQDYKKSTVASKIVKIEKTKPDNSLTGGGKVRIPKDGTGGNGEGIKQPGNDPKKETEGSTKGDKNGILLEDFVIPPTFICLKDKYIVKFQTNVKLNNGYIRLYAKNVDGRLKPIGYAIDKIWDDKKEYTVDIKNSIVKNYSIDDSSLKKLNIKLKNSMRIKLFSEFVGVTNE